MYVRLKHALSALALDAIRSPSRGGTRDAVTWLTEFCDAAATAGGRPGRVVRGNGGTRVPRRLLAAGLVEQRDTGPALPTGFQPYFPYMHRQVRRLAEVLRRLAAHRPIGGRAGALRRGAALFNGGLFFECHEYFEDIWRAAPEADKGFYQGIILVAAGFYHFEKGNLHGARAKLTSGIEKLRRYPSSARGVRLDRWLARLAPWFARIEAGESAGVLRVSEIPRIPLIR